MEKNLIIRKKICNNLSKILLALSILLLILKITNIADISYITVFSPIILPIVLVIAWVIIKILTVMLFILIHSCLAFLFNIPEDDDSDDI